MSGWRGGIKIYRGQMKEKSREPGKRDFLWFHRVKRFRWQAVFHIKTARGMRARSPLFLSSFAAALRLGEFRQKLNFRTLSHGGAFTGTAAISRLLFIRAHGARVGRAI
jgi:hypothetical protein